MCFQIVKVWSEDGAGKVVEIPADMTARDVCQLLVYKSHCLDDNAWTLVEHHPIFGLGKDASLCAFASRCGFDPLLCFYPCLSFLFFFFLSFFFFFCKDQLYVVFMKRCIDSIITNQICHVSFAVLSFTLLQKAMSLVGLPSTAF